MKIRLWTLGSLEHGVVPPKSAIDALKNMLEGMRNSDGTVDLVWGPDLKCQIIDVDNAIDMVVDCKTKEDIIKLIRE